MILRLSKEKGLFEIIHKSNEQQHKFNQPFQVGTNGDSPSVAIMETHDVQDKDLIIVASDGLWDNLYDEDILNMINKNVEHDEGVVKDCNILANGLANQAEKLSLDVDYESPFSKRARARGIEYYGGKEDDITVIVTQIDKVKDSSDIIKDISSSDNKIL